MTTVDTFSIGNDWVHLFQKTVSFSSADSNKIWPLWNPGNVKSVEIPG